MAVCRKRSTTNVPAALSISYLIGSPPIGTSMMTLTSSGGLWPIAMASRRILLSKLRLVWRFRRPDHSWPLNTHCSPFAIRLCPEMLRQLQALCLIVRPDARAIERLRPCQHILVDQAPDDLAVLQDERHLTRAHFQHRARAVSAGPCIAEARIEEARIVHTELTYQRIERHHLGGVVGRHLHGFLGGEDVELVGIEDEAFVGP